MKQLFQSMRNALNQKKGVVLCTIIASSGSTPRGTGAKMAVFEDGSIAGTIGGGAVEHAAIQQALDVHKNKETTSHGYCLAPNDVADLGMVCGGDVTVYFKYYAPEDARASQFVSFVTDVLSRDVNAWLVSQMEGDTVKSMGVYADGMLHHADDIDVALVEPYLRNKDIFTAEQLYIEPLAMRGYVYVFGGGHVAKALVPEIARIGFRPVVFDDREKFVRTADFPHAEKIICAPFENIENQFALTESDYVVIMTRGHQHDYVVLQQVLHTPASYIGMIGSRRKVAATNENLLKDGFSKEDIARVHSPIGLDIKAETPAEIAVSIAAQLILHRATQA